ncbi:MAG: hypothetical protein WD250_15790 [Egibacteraceae bacterium]
MLFVALTAGFLLSWDRATALWPFIPDETRLGHVFIASITIAIGLPALWIAASGSLRPAAAGTADLLVTFAAMSLYLFARSGGDRPGLARYAVGAAAGAFVVICAALLLVATLLVRQTPHVFPWPLAPESSAMYGFIFYGAAVYFLIGAIERRWASAAGQLIGFLAYDLVLIVPFVRHLVTVSPAHRPSLMSVRQEFSSGDSPPKAGGRRRGRPCNRSTALTGLTGRTTCLMTVYVAPHVAV